MTSGTVVLVMEPLYGNPKVAINLRG
jgi:hypothetical protein